MTTTQQKSNEQEGREEGREGPPERSEKDCCCHNISHERYQITPVGHVTGSI